MVQEDEDGTGRDRNRKAVECDSRMKRDKTIVYMGENETTGAWQ